VRGELVLAVVAALGAVSRRCPTARPTVRPRPFNVIGTSGSRGDEAAATNLVVGAFAAYLPARRATAVDPRTILQ
jgi:hypothetical protein